MKNTFKHLANDELPMNEWNSLLQSLLTESRLVTPLVFASIDIVDLEEQWIVSLLEDNEDITSCDHVVTSVTAHIYLDPLILDCVYDNLPSRLQFLVSQFLKY